MPIQRRTIRRGLGVLVVLLVIGFGVRLWQAFDSVRSSAGGHGHGVALGGDRSGTRSGHLPNSAATRSPDPLAVLLGLDDEPEEGVHGTADARTRRCMMLGRWPDAEGDCSFLSPTQDVLDELVRCNSNRFETPSFLHTGNDRVVRYAPPEELVELAGLTDVEVDTIAEVNERFYAQVRTEQRELYLESGGDPDLADGYRLSEMRASMHLDESEPPTAEDVSRELALEAAGKKAPPDTLEGASLAARHLRLWAGMSDRYEEALASELGAARARELRVARDGWGVKGLAYGVCPEHAVKIAEMYGDG